MKIPKVMQRDAKDCGPCCLKSIMAYYGKNIPVYYLREKCFTRRTGTTFLGISEGAESLGLKNITVKLTWEQLESSAPFPCVIHWNRKHFIVLYKITNRKVVVMDPAFGLLKYKKRDFIEIWEKRSADHTSSAMLFEPTNHFHDLKDVEEKKGLRFKDLFSYVKPFRKSIVQIIVATLIGSLISLIFPFLTQSVVDVGIANSNIHFILVILIAQVVLTFGQAANGFVRNWLMLHITTRLSLSFISDFIGKMMRLPIAFFDTKLTGDIIQRVRDFDRIQNFLTGALISMSLALITFIIYAFIMASFKINLLIIFLCGSVLHAFWVFMFLSRRRRLEYMRFQQGAVEHSGLLEMINGMQDIKLNNCEDEKRWKWERTQVSSYKIKTMSLSLNQTQNSGAIFINNITNVILSFISARYVVTGEMTLGMMMSIQYILGQLSAPISQFINFIQDSQDAKMSLERLNEMTSMDDEDNDSYNLYKNIPTYEDIVFDNVSFQYGGKRSPEVLKNIKLRIEANKTTAIVGTSGSGKTTLLKLVLGFYAPTSGKIHLGNKELNCYSPNEWRKNCGVVMQDSYIFSDTAKNNIAPSGKTDNKKLQQACKSACIYDFIKGLPWGFDTNIGPEGMGISTGQRQRILIARAIYKDPQYIILDEATNSLDANNESQIMNNMDVFFKNRTVIIVAHRLSTVKNAHKIIVLDNGKIVEEGKHEELVKLGGHYYTLVKNQLDLGN